MKILEMVWVFAISNFLVLYKESPTQKLLISVEIQLGWIFGLTPPLNLGTPIHNSCLEIQSQIQSVLAIIVQLDKNATRFE